MKNDELIEQIRAFNRFYTSKLGILDTELFDSGFSLTEGRIIYEIGNGQLIARDLTKIISIDEGYLSRILSKMERNGIVSRDPSKEDQRKMELKLTDKGRKILENLNTNSNQQLKTFVEPLNSQQCEKLRSAIRTIHELLEN